MEESKELTEFLCENLEKRHFIKSIHDLQRYQELICSLPARTVLQILLCMSNDRKKDDSDYFINLGTIFLSTLSSFKIRPDEISNYNGRVSFDLLAMILTKNSSWNNGYKLKLGHSNSEINYLHFVLGGLFSYHLSEEPAQIFDYFIKIGLIRGLLDLDPAIEKDKESASKKIQEYISFLHINTGQESLLVARRALAILRDTKLGGGDNPSVNFGTIRVYNETYKKSIAAHRLARENDLKHLMADSRSPNASAFYRNVPEDGDYFGRMLNTVETLTDRIDEKHACFIKAITSKVTDSNGEKRTMLSLFGLLGLISRLLSAPDTSSLIAGLRQDSEIQAFPSFSLEKYKNEQRLEEQEEDDQESLDNFKTSMDDDLLIKAIVSWTKQQSPFKAIPVFTLGQMWDRLSYILKRIDEDNSSKKWLGGYIMHRFCVAFLHAVLTEYLIYLNKIPSLKNPITNDGEFEKNLDIWNDVKPKPNDIEKADLFNWIWSCPIWGVFMDPRSNVYKSYIDNIKEHNESIKESTSIKKELDIAAPNIFFAEYKFNSNNTQYNNLYDPLNSLAIVNSKYFSFKVDYKINFDDYKNSASFNKDDLNYNLFTLMQEFEDNLTKNTSSSNTIYQKYSIKVYNRHQYNQPLILSKPDSVHDFLAHYDFLISLLQSIDKINTIEFLSYLASLVKKPTVRPTPIKSVKLETFFNKYLASK